MPFSFCFPVTGFGLLFLNNRVLYSKTSEIYCNHPGSFTLVCNYLYIDRIVMKVNHCESQIKTCPPTWGSRYKQCIYSPHKKELSITSQRLNINIESNTGSRESGIEYSVSMSTIHGGPLQTFDTSIERKPCAYSNFGTKTTSKRKGCSKLA